ncbi:PAS domain S-box protein [Desulfovibrio sp. TomC]|uniref:PAS domain S-box protein n=1 Tax=Desulfovibrio sp. TomC TaxID=1562888 RepID=UPI0005756DC5|nr:PAS domain S-box protein [Desulfovibrio sp. TomC]KHK03631.1 diguanylate cyclase/phosphodiesterase (GGDEF & EAL domains) with PAS/PAC sensor(s) [Desulfovibrio sp. TomC]
MPQGLLRTAARIAVALFGAMFVVLPGSWLVWHSENARFATARRAEIQLILSESRLALDAALTARIAIVRALSAFAASNPEATAAAFDTFAQILSQSLPDIRSLQLARDLVVSHIHPTISNAGILGLPLLSRLPPAQREALQQAITADNPVLDGPAPLLQGGTGLILRFPVSIPGAAGQPPRLWGLSTVILDASAFFDLAISPASGIRLAIRAAPAQGQPDRLLVGDASVFGNAPVLLSMETPGGSWQLAAIPAAGWSAMPVPPTLAAGSVILWVVLSAALFVLISWPARLSAAVARATAALDSARDELEHTVAQRTAALLAANEALRSSETRYRAFIDATSGMAFLKDDQLRYLVVNRNLCDFYGLPAKDILGRDDAAVMPPALADNCRLSDLAAMHGNEVVATLESMGDRHFEVRKFPVPLGDGKTGVGGYVYDVTDRLAAENALRQSEEALRTLYDNAPVGIFTSTPSGHYLKANRCLARMYGFDSPEEMLDQISDIQDQIYVDPAERQSLLDLLKTRGFLSNHEIRRHTRTGDIVWVSLNILAVRDASGAIIRLEGFCVDITARRQAAAILAQRESELRVIFENSPLGLVAYDSAGAIIKCNSRFLDIIGTTLEQALGANVLAQMPEFARNALTTALNGSPTLVESPYTTVLGGRSLTLRAAFNPVAAANSATAVIASVEDVTTQRRQEQKLRLLRAAVEQSPASIVITDHNGSIEYVNPYFTELTGYAAAEAFGKTPRVLSSGVHDRAFFQAMWETLQAGNIWRGELCNRKRNGELYWENSSISPIRNDQGQITHFVAVKEDITAQKQRETRLHRLMTEFEAIFNASSVGIVHLGGDGRVVRANKRFADLFGTVPETLAGQALDAIHEGENRRQALRQEILAGVAAGGDAYVEERFHNRSGQPFWCAVHARRIDPELPEAGSLWVFDDITARKDLEAIREDVERIMRHDLKAPLNSILTLPELVAALGETTEEQRDILAEIEQAGRVMLDQIDLSLDLYKMETGTYVPEVQRINLGHILATAADMLAPVAKARGVAFALPTDQPAVFALGNALLTQTIAGNLLKNAVEAEDNGSAVTARVFAADGRAGFAVSNRTPVRPEMLPVFFEKYATSGKRGGSGLGTYSARLMTECQGGEIRLDTSEADGTTVTVRLPAVVPEEEERGERKSASGGRGDDPPGPLQEE